MSDVGDFFFGSGSDPGMMGTGQERFDPYNIRENAFQQTTNQMQERYGLLNRQQGIDKRLAPTSEAAQINLAGLQNVSGANIGQAERFGGVGAGQATLAQQAQLAAAERSANVNIGAANTYGGATVDAAAQARAAQLGRQDAQFRSAQMGLTQQLQEQAAGRGPSLAEGQLRAATNRNIAQQQAAAAAAGGPAGLAQRQLRQGAAVQGQEAAAQAAQMRIQEQLAARQQLAGVAQTGREQDINVANAQAQLQQQTALANQAALNQRAAQQAGLYQQAGLANMSALNDRQLQQAQMQMQNQQFNVGQGNQFALQQGQFGQQAALANMQAQNQMAQFNAGQFQQAGLANQQYANQFMLQQAALNQQANLANQQYYNQGMFQNTGYQQQTGLANQQAYLQNQQMNDAMSRYYQEALIGMDQRQQEAAMAYEAMKANQAMGYAGLEQKAYEGARGGKSAMGGMAAGAAAAGIAALAASDEDVKESVTRGNSKVGEFLNQYISGTAKMAGDYVASPTGQQGQNNFMSGAMKGFSMFGGMGSVGGMTGGMGGAAGGGGGAGLGTATSALSSGGGGAAATGGGEAAGLAGGAGAAGAAGGAGAAEIAPAAAAASDKKAKDLSAENDRLKSIMGGMQSQQSSGGPPVVQGFQAGWNMGNKIISAFNTPSTVPTNSVSTAPSYPGYLGGGSYTPDVAPVANSDVTWGTPDMYGAQGMSSSPIGAKTGISSGNMQIGNFLSALGNRGGEAGADPMSGPSGMQAPVSYNKLAGGGMDVMGSGQSMSDQATMYAKSPNFYGDYAPGVGQYSMSDKTSKEDIKSVLDDELAQFLGEVHPYEYSYKNPQLPGRGEGRFVSPMAQELEKTDLGKTAVTNTPHGKMVDYGKLGGVMLAAQAYLNQRLNDLEASQGKKGKK